MKGMEENMIITYSGFRVSGYYTHNGESKREEHGERNGEQCHIRII